MRVAGQAVGNGRKAKRMPAAGRKIRPLRPDFARLRPTGAVSLITRPKKHATGMFFTELSSLEPRDKIKRPVGDRSFYFGAADEARTRYLHLGKVALYQMSYSRIFWCLRAEWLCCGKATAVETIHRIVSKSRLSIPSSAVRLFKWCLRAESNHRHGDFQSPALPTELQRHSQHEL